MTGLYSIMKTMKVESQRESEIVHKVKNKLESTIVNIELLHGAMELFHGKWPERSEQAIRKVFNSDQEFQDFRKSYLIGPYPGKRGKQYYRLKNHAMELLHGKGLIKQKEDKDASPFE
jgi:hypothetical protein